MCRKFESIVGLEGAICDLAIVQVKWKFCEIDLCKCR